jgi:hypothetical protein
MVILPRACSVSPAELQKTPNGAIADERKKIGRSASEAEMI